MTDITDRLERLESLVEEQQETIERQQETIEKQAQRIDAAEAEKAGANELLSAPVTRRSTLAAGGMLALLGVGAGSASATSPTGQVGSSDRPLQGLYTEALNGGLTGNVELNSVVGDGLTIEDGSLSADVEGQQWSDTTVGGEALLQPGSDDVVGIELSQSGDVDIRSDEDGSFLAFNLQGTEGRGTGLRLESEDDTDHVNVIGGSDASVDEGISTATVGGGYANVVSAHGGTIAGGRNHLVSGTRGSVSGGYDNSVKADHGIVGGGRRNDVSGQNGTIGGGRSNVVSGDGGTIPGGYFNEADGEYSLSSGNGAKARHYGQWAHASGEFPNGDAQTSTFVMRAQTEDDDSVAILTLNGKNHEDDGGDEETFQLTDGQAMSVHVQVVARSETGEFTSMICHSAGSRVDDDIEETFEVLEKVDSIEGDDMTTVHSVSGFSTHTGRFRLRLLPEIDEAINWVAAVRATEVSFDV